jgi:hypothetical protein
MSIALHKFVDTHKPDSNTEKADKEIISRYQEYLPKSLLELWEVNGFGLYSKGLIQVINPDLYKETFWRWLMREEDMSRLPIAMSAFGDIFYYRKLSDEGDEDISYLNPHTSEGGDVVWSLEMFFNKWCCDLEVISDFLAKDMFDEAISTNGKLEPNQMYCFVPALRLGGTRSAKNVDRGDAVVHLNILLQLALQA